jgi:hypothetical protein
VSTIPGTIIELRRPIPALPDLLPTIMREELLAGPVPMPIFFALRGRKLSRWDLHGVPADDRDGVARDLGRNSDGVAMMGGIAGHPATWAFKVESVKATCTVLVVLRDGELSYRRV